MLITFKWTPDMSVGDKKIDEQHKQLLDKTNELLCAIIENKSFEIIEKTVDFLDSYVNEHMVYEEAYMKEHDYPEIIMHIKLHEEFKEKYLEFKKRLDSSGPNHHLANDVERYIGNWWINHIGSEDKKYYSFIKRNSQ